MVLNNTSSIFFLSFSDIAVDYLLFIDSLLILIYIDSKIYKIKLSSYLIIKN